MPETITRRLYQGAYALTDADVDTQNAGPGNNTPVNDPAETAEDRNWKKRYGDLRSYTNTLTDRVKDLERQVEQAGKKDLKMPSTREELEKFAHTYPDVYKLIQSITMDKLKQEREDIATEINTLKEKSLHAEIELGYKRILDKHPDFNELNSSEEFHTWAASQPVQVQDWLYKETDPTLCIKALDFYKAEQTKERPAVRQPSERADRAINTRDPVPSVTANNKKVWFTSEIRKLTPRQYEKFEDEIELARLEGRIEFDE